MGVIAADGVGAVGHLAFSRFLGLFLFGLGIFFAGCGFL
jgi:hypothetical protein